jgi:hypothetical protein
MLDRRDQQAVERLPAARLNLRHERERIRLGSAGGENDIARIGRDQRRDGAARIFDHLPRSTPLVMDRRWVPGQRERGGQRIARLDPQWRTRIPVQVGTPNH